MKKRAKVCAAALGVAVLCGILYAGIGKIYAKNEMRSYLRQNNYSEADIQSIEVRHSFVGRLLSYNEWGINVVFADEPASVYTFALKGGKIKETGVTGTTDKAELKHWAENRKTD